MPRDDAKHAQIANEIGDEHVRACKDVTAVKQMTSQERYARFERITNESQHADFHTELTAHVHGTGVAAAHFGDILVLELGDQAGKIETPDKITYDCNQEKLLPNLRKC